MSLWNFVEFEVRRRGQGYAPSPIRLEHRDLPVMDGPAQSEYEHRIASELQGPGVNFTFGWISQDIASCPFACSTFVRARFSRWGSQGTKEGKSALFWLMVLLLSIWVCYLCVHTWLEQSGWRCRSSEGSSHATVRPSSRGVARWEKALAAAAASSSTEQVLFLAVLREILVEEGKLWSFSKVGFSLILICCVHW